MRTYNIEDYKIGYEDGYHTEYVHRGYAVTHKDVPIDELIYEVLNRYERLKNLKD